MARGGERSVGDAGVVEMHRGSVAGLLHHLLLLLLLLLILLMDLHEVHQLEVLQR
jgi:hypothetical protein